MNVSCPQCRTVFRVDPEKVPAAGVRARCSECAGVFSVERGVDRSQAGGATFAAPPPLQTPRAEHERDDSRAAVPEAAAGVEVPDQPEASDSSEPEALPEPRPGSVQSTPAPPARAARESTAPPAPAAAAAPAAASGSPFGSADPHARARRLARALVSDIVVYHPERRDRARQAGNLRQEFREEIRKSWEEYVAQVGPAFARESPYFREALNEILAAGERIF